jgi:DNA-binding NarL/FixJ family response regulator
MRLRVRITGTSSWALQGVAQALQRAGPAGAFEVTVAPIGAPAPVGPPPDVLVVVQADATAAAQLARTAPEGLSLLWLGGTPPAPTAPRRGPTGWLAADADDARLAAAVQALAAGLHVADGAPLLPPRAPAADALPEPLTPRELEVFELLAKGLANREIALALGITSHTAKFHVAQILEKTGAATRTEAVRQGLRLGLIGL